VHLLYPGLDALTDPEKAKEFSRDHQYDIVFLHGGTSTLTFRFRFRSVLRSFAVRRC
jgi:hypothetical protein